MAGDADVSSPYVKRLHQVEPSVVVEVVPVEAVSEVVVDEVIVVVLEKVAGGCHHRLIVDFDRSCDSLRVGWKDL